MTAAAIKRQMKQMARPAVATKQQTFYKTGPGEYGEGDVFMGLTVPEQRQIAKANRYMEFEEIPILLESDTHEHRLVALFILTLQYDRGGRSHRKSVYDLYVKHIDRVNNWDLVDSSAYQIVGRHLNGRSRKPLDRWAKSRSLWRRRIAIVATYAFIRNNQFGDTLRIADVLLNDSHDLIHKAVGWMLREVGNRDRAVMEGFLEPRYNEMPRTMLRYAIERLPEKKRQSYLKGRV